MTTAKWEHLTCEFPDKPHKWKRELGKRGRKPRFCEKHKPAPVPSNSTVTLEPNGMRILHCANGNHDWEREPKRGRVPESCPKHTVTKVIVAAPRNENGKVTLHCEAGNHDWERVPQRGKRPANCPEHSQSLVAPRNVPVNVITGSESGDSTPRRRGRPRIHETPEEAKEAQLKKSQERAANLDSMLKERGTHVSQHAVPYILYKKIGEKRGRNGNPPTITWEKVAEHTPLSAAQYVNKHEADFVAGNYRYEKEGKVLNLL
jgi:hypothetical protein